MTKYETFLLGVAVGSCIATIFEKIKIGWRR